MVAVTSPDEVPVPTNSSTKGVVEPAAVARATSATVGGVGRCENDELDTPQAVEKIMASKPADTIR